MCQTGQVVGWRDSGRVIPSTLAALSPVTLCSITQRVTIWAPTEDEIVPVHLVERLAARLPDSTITEIPGAHDWPTQNWWTVLERIAS